MAYYDILNIQFLDLSGVDEVEKQWILSSLKTVDNTVKGPWNKAVKERVSNVHATGFQANCHNSFTPHNAAALPNHINPVIYPPPNYQPPLTIYPTTFVPTIQQQQQYTPPTVAVNAPVVVPVIPAPIIVNKQYPVTYPAQQPGPVVEKDEHKCEVENHVNNVNITNGNATETQADKSDGSKSWASLFNRNALQAASNNCLANANKPSDIPPFPQPNQNNNNAKNIFHMKSTQFDDPNYYRMAEILASRKLDHNITSVQPRGLINHSNYCYINSILQAMLACPPVYNLLSALTMNISTTETRKHSQVIDNMVRFVREFRHLRPNQRVTRRVDNKVQKKEQSTPVNCDRPFEPYWIYKMLNGMRSDSFVVEGRQEDAEEFLGCLLNGLNDEMLELMKLVEDDMPTNTVIERHEEIDEEDWQLIGKKNKGCVTRRTEVTRTPISDIFGGHIRSRLHRAGDQITDNIQPFFTLQLNIEKVNTVCEALEALVTKNQLEGVTSSKTNEEVEAWQQVTIEELPVVLVLHLKCFDFKPEGCTKIIKALEFPVDLKIDSKLLSSKTNYQPKEKQYKLFAVVYHDGKEATKGHFITDAYHVGYARWIRYDDVSVNAVQEEQVLKPHGTRVPYLLFYRRADTVRSK
ncbi:PREDICTED: ubiquitin carboxyl-terminal hydrolase 10-B [Nicrophorus vespilloides]|uniref:ubiquitinyl hydrolase 1 n=1 Tax=Nicrophorus vespilloides TaxID=110193 RepID=A0ABM1NHS4_NICVS|nr:PREDICTED: ubiquitin carboxyl-terminal hydrolase 10-B [Nicrophorus vespilloides]